MNNWTPRIKAKDKPIFNDIKSGLKTIETRVATEKYKKIKQFRTRDKMFIKIPFKEILPRSATEKETREKYDSFPGYPEKIKKFGLVAFYL